MVGRGFGGDDRLVMSFGRWRLGSKDLGCAVYISNYEWTDCGR